MVALAKSFMEPPREPGFRVDPEFVREERREHVESSLQQQEDWDARAPVLEGDDWTDTP